MSAAITAAVVGVAGSAYSANQQKKAQQKAREAQQAAGSGSEAAGAAGQQSRDDIQWVNDLNRQNALWTQRQNAVNQTTDFGSTSYDFDPETGRMTAKQSLAPEQQAMLEKLRDQQDTAIGGMESGFNVNNDVMNAMRAQSAPLMQQQRAKENARLAAMGLATGSGSAWGTAQDALNRSDNDMEQKNILGGFNAWNQEQTNNRANLGALNATEQGWAGMAPSLAPPQVAATTVAQPTNKTFEGWAADQAQANTRYGQDMAAQGAQNGYTGQIVGALGGLVGNKDIQGAVKNWWSTPSTGSTDNAWGYTSGTAGGTNTTGFDW